MLRFLAVLGLLAIAGYMLYLVFGFEHDGGGLEIMLALLAAGFCLIAIVLLVKRGDREPGTWDGFDDGFRG